MSADLKARALALYKAPFRFIHGYIQDADTQTVADNDGGEAEPVRVRGWGRISYMPDAESLQDEVGAIIAEALTEYWNRRAPVQAPAVALSELPPLPQFFALGKTRINGEEHGHYSAKQMQDYARAALAQAPQSDDAARLDWLEMAMAGNHPSTPYYDEQGMFGFPELVHGSPMGGGVGFRNCGSSLRDAIDAARAIAALTGSKA